MRYVLSLGLVLSTCAVAYSQQAGAGSGDPPTSSAIPYSTMQFIDTDDSPEVIAEKAAKVLPRPNQAIWMRLERTFFIHFGPNTFRGVEWGNGREAPSVFNPSALDAGQWVTAVKDSGGRM